MDTDLLLNCWLVDDSAKKVLLPKQPTKQQVVALRYLIVALIKSTQLELDLWKVSIPLGDASSPTDVLQYAEKLEPADALSDYQTLGEIFPSAPPGLIHIIAKFKSDATSPPAKRPRLMKNSSDFEAFQKEIVVSSWNSPYSGTAASLFIETINLSLSKSYYAQYLPVIQSSGTGKSRYPPPDEGVVKWFTETASRQSHSFQRSYIFLVALSIITLKSIEELVHDHDGEPPVDLPKQFRAMMRKGQSYSSPGSKRKDFFDRVIVLAKEMLPKFVTRLSGECPAQPRSPEAHVEYNGDKLALLESFTSLLKSIEKYDHNTGPTTKRVRLLLAFDEAHALYDSPPEQTWSTFSELRRALRALRSIDVFSVFLSTTGKIDLLAPAAQYESSERLQRRDMLVHPPFTALGFDQLALKAKDGACDIDTVVKPEFLFFMGRPLFGSRYTIADKMAKKSGDADTRDEIATFAKQKLISSDTANTETQYLPDAKFAVLAVRMALELNATTHAAADRERVQIEKHMRICVGIAEGNASLVSVAPSEPALVEGAILAMRQFNAPQALLEQLETLGVSEGGRGEMVSMLLMLLARDRIEIHTTAVPITQLLKKLFHKEHHAQLNRCLPTDCHKTLKTKTLLETFGDSYCHFTHFVKVNDYEVINRRFLWRMMVRGAAILCADNQRAVDIIIPVCIQGKQLQETNMTVILLQSKNHVSLSSYNQSFFDPMHPVVLGIFPSGVEDIPIIRLVFSLGSKESDVSLASPPSVVREPRATQKSQPMRHYKHAYDIWASSASSKTFAVIEEEEDLTYDAILKTRKVFPQAYTMNGDKAAHVSRSMHPGAGIEASHWAMFAPL